jgi:hypothetical protein
MAVDASADPLAAEKDALLAGDWTGRVPRTAFEASIEVSGTSLSVHGCLATDANASTGGYLFEGKAVPQGRG